MDNNDRLFSIALLILTALIFLSAVCGVTFHILMGYVHTFGGYLFSAVIVALSWAMLRTSWKELFYHN